MPAAVSFLLGSDGTTSHKPRISAGMPLLKLHLDTRLPGSAAELGEGCLLFKYTPAALRAVFYQGLGHHMAVVYHCALLLKAHRVIDLDSAYPSEPTSNILSTMIPVHPR